MAYEERKDMKTEEETIKLMDKLKNEGRFDGKIDKERNYKGYKNWKKKEEKMKHW